MTVACVRSSQLCLPGSLPTAKLPDAAVQQLKAATLPMQGNMYDLFLSSAGWGGADATRGGLYEFQLATILGDPQNAEELCQAVATLRYEIPELCVGDDGDPEKFLQKILAYIGRVAPAPGSTRKIYHRLREHFMDIVKAVRGLRAHRDEDSAALQQHVLQLLRPSGTDEDKREASAILGVSGAFYSTAGLACALAQQGKLGEEGGRRRRPVIICATFPASQPRTLEWLTPHLKANGVTADASIEVKEQVAICALLSTKGVHPTNFTVERRHLPGAPSGLRSLHQLVAAVEAESVVDAAILYMLSETTGASRVVSLAQFEDASYTKSIHHQLHAFVQLNLGALQMYAARDDDDDDDGAGGGGGDDGDGADGHGEKVDLPFPFFATLAGVRPTTARLRAGAVLQALTMYERAHGTVEERLAAEPPTTADARISLYVKAEGASPGAALAAYRQLLQALLATPYVVYQEKQVPVGARLAGQLPFRAAFERKKAQAAHTAAAGGAAAARLVGLG